MATPIDAPAIDAVIRRNLRLFRNKGVLTVRPGYKFTGGWITDKPAIVATVDKKLEDLPPAMMLPAEVENVPVDVREATGLQRLRAQEPTAHALVTTHGRREIEEPQWDYERDPNTGTLISEAEAPVHTALAAMSKPEVPYVPAPGVPLSPVTARMKIIASASPDSGWPVLRDFLNGINSSLTVGMYDFTSAHVLDTLEAALTGAKTLQLVLDHPPRNPSANQTDDETKSALETALTSRAKIDWALTRNDPVVDAWIFPTAYHIKVAVRDSETFWLSSGNWNNSNQPDLAAHDGASGSLQSGDRDWHVVITNTDLAKIFEAYLKQDYTSALAHQGSSKPAIHAALRDAMTKLAAESAKSSFNQVLPQLMALQAAAPKLVPAKTFDAIDVEVDPILTPDPDIYSGRILALLNSAQKTLYMQTQYIHPSGKPVDAKFDALIAAVRDRHRAGVDVRLITSQYENTAQWIEKIKQYDLDGVLRIQNRVHNKGIVVDSKVVALGSQNWSGDGTLRNRDASVVIHHPDVAQYFESIFIDDWNTRAKAKLVDASHPAGNGSDSTGGTTRPKKKPTSSGSGSAKKKTTKKKKTTAKKTAKKKTAKKTTKKTKTTRKKRR